MAYNNNNYLPLLVVSVVRNSDRAQQGLTLLHNAWSLSRKTQGLRTGIICSLLHLHAWQLMLAVGLGHNGSVGQNTYTQPLLVTCTSSQRGSWVPRSSIPREEAPGRSHVGFYDLASEVTEHHFCPILLVEAGRSTLVPYLSIKDCHRHCVKTRCTIWYILIQLPLENNICYIVPIHSSQLVNVF